MDLYGSLVANEGSGGGGGTTDVPIKSISVNGKGVVPVNKNVDIDVPTKTSELQNDSNFASTGDIPTKTSQLENDSNFASTGDIPTKTSELQNDSSFVTEDELNAKGYASADSVPTKTSQLTNDSSFVTESDLTAKDYADKTYVGEQIAQSEHLKRKFVTVLPEPAEADEHTIYMLKDESVQGDDKYKEYMLINGVVQCVGDTSVDLTDYAKKTDLHSHTNKEVLDGITAEKVEVWDKAQENVIESVKVNNQEITPDENKAVNIDLTGYAEHDEIIGENLIPFPYAQPERTTNGVTFTLADDGSVIANGTATGDADFSVCVRTDIGTDKALMLKPGIYAITGCPEGGSDSTYRIHVQFGDKTGVKYNLRADYGKGFVFEVTEEHALYACQIQCHVKSGYTVSDLVFKPMLVRGSALKAYQPYKLSRKSLRNDIDDVNKLASSVDNQFATASGDSITIRDSVASNIIELGIKGNSVQKSYSGYNLLKYPFFETSKTVGGITVTDNKDGSITINGTNGNTYVDIFTYENRNNIFKAGTYHVSGVGIASLYFNSYGANGSYDIDDSGEITFTVDYDFYIKLKSICKANTSYDNVTYHPMIVKVADDGTYPTEYEPYVGGTPSPSPSYPQEIKSVGDDGSIVVKSCGKNLIPYPYNDGGVRTNLGLTTTSLPNGIVSVSGTNTGKGGLFNFNYPTNASSLIKLDPNKTYAFFNPLKTDRKNQITLGVRWYLEGQELSTGTGKNTNIVGNGNSNEAVIMSGFSYAYVYLYAYNSGKTFNNVLFAPMLVEVNEDGTYPTDYEIYKSSTTTIPLSEPLRAIGDVKDEITYQDGKWGVLRRTGSIILNGTKENCSSSTINDSEVSKCYKVEGVLNESDIGNYITSYFSSHFEVVNSPTLLKTQGKTLLNVSETNSALYLSLGTDIATVDDFKNFLSTNRPEFVYKLRTPTFEPFADQTLQYIPTYEDVTYISNDDALSAEMTAKYPTTDASGVGSRNASRIAELEETKADKCSVSDVAKTNIELIDTTNYTVGDNSGYSFYQVINGICYVDLLLTCVNPINGNTSSPGHLSLPKARSSFHTTLIGANGTTDNIVQYVGASGVSFFKYGTAGKLYVGHFSYPVAE